MDPSLVVVGLNFKTSPVAVRERFWMNELRRYEALHHLVRAEGIDEVIVLATCNRTEFILWTSDPGEAANSVLRFLTQEYGLKMSDWSHFYRLMDDVALMHVFRVASSLDSMVIGEPEIVGQFKTAWSQAQSAGATGRFLDAVMQKALTVSKRVRNETAIGNAAVSIPYTSVELSKRVLGELFDKSVVLMGAGKMSELAARYLMNNGASKICVINRTLHKAEEFSEKVGGIAVSLDERAPHLDQADIIVSSTSCPHFVIERQDAERIQALRGYRPIVMIDIAVPRDIDPAVRQVEGVHLFDMDDLEKVVQHNEGERQSAAVAAEKILAEEARGFRRKLLAERVVPTIVALRNRLDELCRQELESLRQELGPFTEDQDQAMSALTAHITQRIAGSLARELKELPERGDQDMLTSAVQRLFHLDQPKQAAAGTRN
ncbi:MAG TPA: glutamyl-tRNA reductase [Candidatus Koribacter sp.]